jgi:hypothetical protein
VICKFHNWNEEKCLHSRTLCSSLCFIKLGTTWKGMVSFTFCPLYLCMLWTEDGWAPLFIWARWWIQSPSSGKDSTLVAGPIASYSKHLHKHNALCIPRMTYFINDLLYLVSLEVTSSLGFQESGIHKCTICDVWLYDHACRMMVLNRFVFYLCITASFSLQYVWFWRILNRLSSGPGLWIG